jgi:tripartite ATP-independent transporter DctM subunit
VPIAYALAGIGLFGLFYIYGSTDIRVYLAVQLFSHISKFTFTAVPLFLLMGYLAFNAGLTKDAYDAASAWVGKLPGNVALTTVTGCAFFAACAGSSLAECAAMSKIAVPEMRRIGYSMRLATGVVASAGCLAVLIPPSIIMVIFGVITETSIGELLLAGLLPGLLYFAVFALGILLFSYLKPSSAPRQDNLDTSWKAKKASIRKVGGIMSLFLLIVVGIYSGFVTPTEAAGLGAAGAIVVSVAKRRFEWQSFRDAVIDTMKGTAVIFLLLGSASIFTIFMSVTGVIQSATSYLISLEMSPHLLLLFILALYIILGMFLDSISMMILTIPLVLPIIQDQGYSIIWFGVMITMMVEIGCITPPMGLNVYVIKGALGDQVELTDIFMGSLPFVLLQFLIVYLLYAFPGISLWLPSLMLN